MVKLFHKGIKIGHEYPFARLRAAILLGTWFADDPGPLIALKGFVNKVLQLVSFKLKRKAAKFLLQKIATAKSSATCKITYIIYYIYLSLSLRLNLYAIKRT